MTGYIHLKTGDLSGHLCYDCDEPMIIDKTKPKKRGPIIYCRCCGRKIEIRRGLVGFGMFDEVYI